jgi:hypothetical protein
VTAFHGSVSSTRSIPSLATRKATVLSVVLGVVLSVVFMVFVVMRPPSVTSLTSANAAVTR